MQTHAQHERNFRTSERRLRYLFTAHHLARNSQEREPILKLASFELDNLADALQHLDDNERDDHGNTPAEWTRLEAELVRFVAATENTAPQGFAGVAPWNTTKVHALRNNHEMGETLRELSMVADRHERADLLAQLYDTVVDSVGGQAAEVIASLENDLRTTPRFTKIRRWWNNLWRAS